MRGCVYASAQSGIASSRHGHLGRHRGDRVLRRKEWRGHASGARHGAARRRGQRLRGRLLRVDGVALATRDLHALHGHIAHAGSDAQPAGIGCDGGESRGGLQPLCRPAHGQHGRGSLRRRIAQHMLHDGLVQYCSCRIEHAAAYPVAVCTSTPGQTRKWIWHALLSHTAIRQLLAHRAVKPRRGFGGLGLHFRRGESRIGILGRGDAGIRIFWRGDAGIRIFWRG